LAPRIRPALAACISICVFASATASAQGGDPARGERVFQRCFACHSVDPKETAKLRGPSLYRILGRPAGRIQGFDYSPALLDRARAGLVWDQATLDAYLADPEAIVSGTRMSIPPMRDARERADLIAFLASGAH